jgi:hypothetical protein
MTNATCAVEDCARPPLVRGWCNAHYQRVLKFGSPRADLPLRPRRRVRIDECACSVEGCGRAARWHGWCPPHYKRWQRYGNPEAGRAMRGTLSGRPCKVDGCGEAARGGLGWCKRHYQKYFKTGNAEAPDKRIRPGTPIRERIEARVIKTDHCWFWTAHVNAGGYGIINITTQGGKKSRLAHRVSYEAFVGPIPDGMVLDHRCRNRACVRPDHLEPVPHEVNVRRGASTERGTHCGNGHEYTKASTRWVRVCVTCADASRERSKARKAA